MALVDCNNFYVSCERVFDAKLIGRPVIVLSNNDGCAIARSAEAKALGIKMGDPWHQMQQLAKQHGIVARSSNYVLYGDMSARVVSILRTFAADVEVYSIDESFLDLGNMPIADLRAHGRAIVQRVQQWVGMPVCVGIGPSKTLAKLANHVAKKTPRLASVCDFGRLSPEQLMKVLDRIEVGDVWGVGRRLSVRLGVDGIKTAGDLARADTEKIKRQY
ncbi:MAG: Y-family DNA polymerase, partial [Rubrivivax sp.]